MMLLTATIIDKKLYGEWVIFSSQIILEGETPRTDEQYLADCRERYPELELRIRPLAEDHGYMFDPAEARRLRAEGLAYKAISERLGVSETRAFLACRNMRA